MFILFDATAEVIAERTRVLGTSVPDGRLSALTCELASLDPAILGGPVLRSSTVLAEPACIFEVLHELPPT